MLQLVGDDFLSVEQRMIADTEALASLIKSGRLSQGMIVAVVDGAVTYAPLGVVTLIEATGMLELASRKVERDLS